ncbi:MAG: von Willebrand factor type A domain-containing protein, partial [Pseudomonadota bacterium]
MNDDLDRLKAAMDAATPAPDAARKAADLALARKNFAARQESAPARRQTSDRPEAGLFRGVKTMIMQINARGALAATTALVALGLVVTVPDWQMRVPDAPVQFAQEEAVASAPSKDAARPAPEAAQDVLADAARPQVLSRAATGAQMSAEVLPAPLPEPRWMPDSDTEAFAGAETNPLRVTVDDPVSTFSVDVDTASYGVVRSSLRRGQMPPRDAVRVEEMVNYFPYDYAAPGDGDAPFRPTVSVMPTPWNADTQLVRVAIQGARPDPAERPPLNLVFLVDTSGSMQAPDKLELLKQSLALMLPQLTERDEIAIVAYAGQSGVVLEPTQATERGAIRGALDSLTAGGGTAGQAGLQDAYAMAERMAEEGEVSRVILATDGDFNIGLSDPDALEDYIAGKRDSGVYLSVMGFGRGNLDDATMQALAQNGNGQAGYIDTLSEAQKVMVDQLSGALYPIADDVKVQVEFNPARVAEYRLIGYETRVLRREDFANDVVDAGDIGAGHQVTALYEITPVGSPARLTEPLRYGTAEPTVEAGDELGFLKLRY